LAEKYVHNSTYAFSENKVTAHVELEGLESISINPTDYLWRDVGISSSSDLKEFVKNVGKEMVKPQTWFLAYAQTAQIIVPLVITTVMTGGFGDAAVVG
jgi:hypothetical protein